MKAHAIPIDIGTDADTGKPVYHVYLAGPKCSCPSQSLQAWKRRTASPP